MSDDDAKVVNLADARRRIAEGEKPRELELIDAPAEQVDYVLVEVDDNTVAMLNGLGGGRVAIDIRDLAGKVGPYDVPVLALEPAHARLLARRLVLVADFIEKKGKPP